MPKAEKEDFQKALQAAADAAYAWVSEPMDIVMNRYNIKVSQEKNEQ